MSETTNNLLFSKLSKANTADELDFVTTDKNSADKVISYTNLLSSIVRDTATVTLFNKAQYQLSLTEFASYQTIYVEGNASASTDITVSFNSSIEKPVVVKVLKDASVGKIVRLNFENFENGALDGTRVGFYGANFYDLMFASEGVSFLLIGSKIVVLDRMGMPSFCTEVQSNMAPLGSVPLNGTFQVVNPAFRRAFYLTSGTIGIEDSTPYFLNGAFTKNLSSRYAKIDFSTNCEAMSLQSESLPNITGRFVAVDSGDSVTKIAEGPFYKNDYHYNWIGKGDYGRYGYTTYGFNASICSATYQTGAKVNPDSYKTQLHLYI